MLKADTAASVYHIEAGLRIVIITVTPYGNSGRTVTHLCLNIGIKQPEGNINPLNLINMILILKNLRQQSFAGQMAFQAFLRRLLIQLEGNQNIRLQRTRKLSHHNHGVAAEGARGCRRVFIAHNFAAAGLTYISTQSIGFALRPVIAGRRFPFHFICLFALQLLVIAFQCVHFKFRVAVRTLHLLERAVKCYCAATARAFIFLQTLHNRLLSFIHPQGTISHSAIASVLPASLYLSARR